MSPHVNLLINNVTDGYMHYNVDINQALLLVREEERVRLSQELHDTVGQSLAALKLGVRQAMEAGELPHSGTLLVSQINDLIESARAITADLRNELLHEQGLMKAIQDYALSTGQRYNIRINISVGDEVDKDVGDDNDRLQLFRIVQESITNAIKHSRASDITVEIIRQDNTYIFTIRDNGIGFDPAASERVPSNDHFGLRILHERSCAIGAELDIKSSRGNGTIVSIRYMQNIQEDL